MATILNITGPLVSTRFYLVTGYQVEPGDYKTDSEAEVGQVLMITQPGLSYYEEPLDKNEETDQKKGVYVFVTHVGGHLIQLSNVIRTLGEKVEKEPKGNKYTKEAIEKLGYTVRSDKAQWISAASVILNGK